MRIGVAIPCFIKHISRCYELLDSINGQTRLPDQVVVSCSSSKPEDFIKKEYKFPLTVIITEERKNASQNRNIAASNLDTDVITFFDADDIMHPQRLEVIDFTFKDSIDIMLHSFFLNEECNNEFPLITNIMPIKNVLSIAPSGCITWDNSDMRIHHGQVTVTRGVFEKVKFPEESYFETREDCIFCLMAFLLPNIQSAYIMQPLSKYIESRTCHTEKQQ
jgi:glycosyltransferase involved in cell wall biosynthesis